MKRMLSALAARVRRHQIRPMVWIGAAIFLVVILMALLAPFLTSDPLALSDAKLAPPSWAHPFGTDILGREIFSRVVYGAQSSVGVALIAVSLSVVVGAPLGAFAAYIGGKFDQILSVPIDALYAFPSLISALAVALVLGRGVVNTGIAVAFSWIPMYYKVMRSITLSLKGTQLVEAEKSIGAGNLYIVLHHIMPRTLSTLAVLMSLGLGRAVLAVSGLGFLGFGVQPPTPEWGTDLSSGRVGLLSGTWWPVFFPGFMIFIMVLGLNLLGEGLNEMLSPALRVRQRL